MRAFLKLVVILSLPVAGFAATGAQTLVNEAGLTYNNTYTQNLNAYGSPNGAAGKVSAQVNFSSVAFNAATFTDGTQSTSSLTVVSTSTIVGLRATNNMTVPTTAAILGSPATAQFTVIVTTGLGQGATAQITVNANTFTSSSAITLQGLATITLLNGNQWSTGIVSSNTAASIASAINQFTAITGIVASQSGTSAVVFTSATAMSPATNLYLVTDNVPSLLSTTTFSGEVQPAVLTVNGNVLTNGIQWTAQSTTSGTAQSITAAVNSLGQVAANWPGGTSAVVNSTADVIGFATNLYTIGSSVLGSISTTTFSGGSDRALLNAFFTLNGVKHRNGYHWNDVSNTSTGTALSIMADLNLQGVVLATVPTNGSVIYTTATTPGTAGNAFTLTSSTTTLLVNTPTFVNGQDPATITINGVSITLGIAWPIPTIASTTANEATAIAAAINANASLASIITAGATGAVVFSTSNAVGKVNYTTVSSTQSQLSFSNTTMTGGTTAAININTDIINLPGHGWTTALEVFLTTGTNVVPGGLLWGTTYFAIIIDSNNIQLASTSTGAIAGLFVNITSSATGTTSHIFTLNPEAFSLGSAAGKWQVSNDGVSFNDFLTNAAGIAVTNQTFTPVFPSTSTAQDFGQVDYNFLRYNVTAPTQGAVKLKVILGAKD